MSQMVELEFYTYVRLTRYLGTHWLWKGGTVSHLYPKLSHRLLLWSHLKKHRIGKVKSRRVF